MDSLETPAAPQPDLNELKEQLVSLKQLVHSLLVVLIIISGTLNIYLLRQYKFNKSDLAAVRPQATQIAAEYDKNKAAMADFINKLTDYGKAHTDFEPIMLKYGLGKTAGKTGGALGTEPGPAGTKK